jgi:hypothetical protein
MESARARIELTMSIGTHEELSRISDSRSAGKMMTIVNEYAIIVGLLDVHIKSERPFETSSLILHI